VRLRFPGETRVERMIRGDDEIGAQQLVRVALARAFVVEPRVLFADEPTGNLDAATGAGIIDLLFELNAERGTTLMLVTHDEMVARRCVRQIRLVGGRIVNGAR